MLTLLEPLIILPVPPNIWVFCEVSPIVFCWPITKAFVTFCSIVLNWPKAVAVDTEEPTEFWLPKVKILDESADTVFVPRDVCANIGIVGSL